MRLAGGDGQRKAVDGGERAEALDESFDGERGRLGVLGGRVLRGGCRCVHGVACPTKGGGRRSEVAAAQPRERAAEEEGAEGQVGGYRGEDLARLCRDERRLVGGGRQPAQKGERIEVGERAEQPEEDQGAQGEDQRVERRPRERREERRQAQVGRHHEERQPAEAQRAEERHAPRGFGRGAGEEEGAEAHQNDEQRENRELGQHLAQEDAAAVGARRQVAQGARLQFAGELVEAHQHGEGGQEEEVELVEEEQKRRHLKEPRLVRRPLAEEEQHRLAIDPHLVNEVAHVQGVELLVEGAGDMDEDEAGEAGDEGVEQKEDGRLGRAHGAVELMAADEGDFLGAIHGRGLLVARSWQVN